MLTMSNESTTVVDFVARGEAPDEWRMVLVEEGPWPKPINEQLRRVQTRLYGCIDAAIDGQLAEQFPESKGKKIIIQLDCYNLPREEVSEFFDRFSDGVLKTEDYRDALLNNENAKSISFKINFDAIH